MSKTEKEINDYYKSVALHWKTESRKLMLKYEKDEKAFEIILHSVVGKGGGGVLRNISKDYFSKFSKYILDNLASIKNGTFDIFKVETFPDKQPVSFASKICHILNPKAYPVIYDSRVRTAFKIGSGKNTEKKWDEKISEIKSTLTGKESVEDLYNKDFDCWIEGSNNIFKKI